MLHLTRTCRYEEEIARLRHELEARGGPSQSQHGGPSQPPPPSIGHGPANLFQGIMAGGGAGGPGLAPPPQEQAGQPGMPGHMQAQGPPGLNQPPGPPHNPFPYPQAQQGPGVNGKSAPTPSQILLWLSMLFEPPLRHYQATGLSRRSRRPLRAQVTLALVVAASAGQPHPNKTKPTRIQALQLWLVRHLRRISIRMRMRRWVSTSNIARPSWSASATSCPISTPRSFRPT